ncbi:MAG: serine/threonine protein kinase, partial [Deltaproteobacteria bacterium]|nr:serine/threonine protein kinase [Deltaproteobacteria bacterium]
MMELLGGRYRLLGRRGPGGQGGAWRAEDLDTGRTVLIKRAADPGGRLAREADFLRRVQHPHLVRLLDTGTDPEGRPFLVQELVEGPDLARRLDG